MLKAVFGIFALLPALLVAALAFPRLSDGSAQSKAAPVPSAMIAGASLDRERYRYAADQLEHTAAGNGEGRIEAAEAARYAGADAETVGGHLRAALIADPASARGWMLLSEVSASADSSLAASALSQSFLLAPNDFFLAGRRANDAAQIWDRLDPETQRMALRQTQLLWDEEAAHVYLRPLLTTPAGVALVTRAFADRRDDLRAMNRWLFADRLRHPDVVRPWP